MEQLHRIDLHQCIADIHTIRKPDLIVMDAIRILTTNGPKGPGKTEDIGEVIVGTDGYSTVRAIPWDEATSVAVAAFSC